MTMRVRSGSADLAAEWSGNGPALVCLHARVSDRRMFAVQVRDLGHAFEVISYDRRGFGETWAIDEPCPLGDLRRQRLPSFENPAFVNAEILAFARDQGLRRTLRPTP